MSQKYADIIINISHEEVDRAFQYKIPDNLLHIIKVGTLVNIPFGQGNKLRQGYVIDISDKANWDVNKIKEIDSISQTSVVIEGRLIELAFWIKQHYGGTMINALKTVMPVKQKVNAVVKKKVLLNISGAEILDKKSIYERKNAKAKLRLLKELETMPEMSMDMVKNHLNISNSTLKALESEGVILILEKNTYRSAENILPAQTAPITLNEDQQKIVDDFEMNLQSSKSITYLLKGITGSGKTEIYVRCIQKVVAQNKQAIVLIPEIALTYQTVKYFKKYFGDRVTIINSRLSAGEKYDQFERAKKGEVDVVIGPRSALFAPFLRLGLIIVDEEHESSYKSDYPPKYHAREVAINRAERENAFVILGSATPSVESYFKAKNDIYKLWELNKRARESSCLAKTSIVDLRQELKQGHRSIISRELAKDIGDRLEKKQQIMLFLNRRGYNSFVSCRSCGEAIKCPHCDVTLTKHESNKLICHYCGYTIMEPKKCPVCSSSFIGGYGTGTEKVEEEIHKLFPQARTLRMDKDTTKKKNAHMDILEKFTNFQADILIGTQMIVKGHDFSNVTLVGVILADLTLFNNDFRAGERTFDLLTQAAGRAGRGNLPGKVVIQTYKPENYAIVSAANQDYESFYQCEISYRKMLKYPPLSNMMAMLMISENEEFLDDESKKIKDEITVFAKDIKDISLIGPAPPAISKIKDIYRRIIYIKGTDYNTLIDIKDLISDYLEEKNLDNRIGIQFDFNPVNMY